MTAEELRDELLLGVKRKDYTWLRMKTDSLIAAARAEGAEQERERIRKAGIPVDNIKFSMDGKVMHIMELTTDGRDTMPSYFVPASVLTPKEQVMQKQMEEQVMEDQQKEDMLAEERKRNERQADVERWNEENKP